MKNPTSILITGASGGLGAALARAYAAPDVFLALTGRNQARLEAAAESCRGHGAEVATAGIDVVDAAALAAWLVEIDERRPLDLVIANAGISGGTVGGEGAAQTRRIFAVNVDGALNTVLPAIPRMQARRRGQIALMSSLSAFRALPGSPAYSASKAAVRFWGEALRGVLARDGIGVSVICLGYVRTPMTEINAVHVHGAQTARVAGQIVAQQNQRRIRPVVAQMVQRRRLLRAIITRSAFVIRPLVVTFRNIGICRVREEQNLTAPGRDPG